MGYCCTYGELSTSGCDVSLAVAVDASIFRHIEKTTVEFNTYLEASGSGADVCGPARRFALHLQERGEGLTTI